MSTSVEHKGMSIVKLANQDVPEQFLRSALKAYPTTFGVCTPAEGGLSVSHSHADFDKLKRLTISFHAKPLLMYFGNFPADFNKDSCQPFRMLVDSGKKTILTCTAVGDFKKHVEDGAKNSDAWWGMHSKLLPQLQQIYRLCGEDFNKFIAELKHD